MTRPRLPAVNYTTCGMSALGSRADSFNAVQGDHTWTPITTNEMFLRNAGLLGLAGVAGSKVTTALAADAAPPTITLPFDHGVRQVVQYPL